MAKTTLSYEHLLKAVQELPYKNFAVLVRNYAANNGENFEHELKLITTEDLQLRLENLGINSVCPACGSSIITKSGKRTTGIQVFKCTACGIKFTRFTGTILEKTRWHWDIWIKVLQETLNNTSIQRTVNMLEQDFDCNGIDSKTVWLWRMKLIHAMASHPMPKLTGVIQVDETFIRESQKGSRNLVSNIKGEDRIARYGRVPSKLGVLGPEFATVTTAIDNTGHCVCKVSGLGKLTPEQFIEQFEEHLVSPSYLCSDANNTYLHYSQLFNIPHYIKPSNYLSVLEKNGYITGNKLSTEVKKKNQSILRRLYNAELIDKICNRGSLTFDEFQDLKTVNGLSLGRVNQLHSDIKKMINGDKINVSTKYLQDYIGYFTYVKNWTVDHGHYPSSTKDAELIFLDILKLRENYTIQDVKNQPVNLQKPSGRYVSQLKAETKKAREATGNKYFKFDEEDGFKNFDRRAYLFDLPKYQLFEICKECGLKKYKSISRWSVISQLLERPDIDMIIYRLLGEGRHYDISDEDLEEIKAGHFKIKVKERPPAD